MFGRNTKTKTAKNRRKAQVKRATDARKVARKQTNKEGSRIQAVRRATAVARNFQGLPIWLWFVVIPLAYNIVKKTWVKEEAAQNLRNAHRVLRESRGYRALPDDVELKGRK